MWALINKEKNTIALLSKVQEDILFDDNPLWFEFDKQAIETLYGEEVTTKWIYKDSTIMPMWASKSPKQLIKDKTVALKASRANLLTYGFVYNNVRVDCEPDSQASVNGKLQGLKLETDPDKLASRLNWLGYNPDTNERSLLIFADLQAFETFAKSVVDTVEAIFAAYSLKLLTLEQLTDLATIKDFDTTLSID
jgi:hypothetical protein